MTTASSRAIIHHGNDLYREIALPAFRTSFNVTYWDVWMLALLVGEFGGNWDIFADHFRSKIKTATYDRDTFEGFLNHLRLLRRTLTENHLHLEDVLGKDAGSVLKGFCAKSTENSKRESSEKGNRVVMTKKSPSDVLAQLSANDALAVLRILARDEAIAERIRQVAETYQEGHAPHSPQDIATIAEDVRAELENLEVEEVWDRAGQTRHGYVETAEAADEMMQRVLDPYLETSRAIRIWG